MKWKVKNEVNGETGKGDHMITNYHEILNFSNKMCSIFMNLLLCKPKNLSAVTSEVLKLAEVGDDFWRRVVCPVANVDAGGD